MKNASALIESLELNPHPEGGWYREIYRSPLEVTALGARRSAGTAIYYLLQRGQASRWHVIDADEIWHLYAGEGLELLSYSPSTRELRRQVLGGQIAQPSWVAVVPSGRWQAARPIGDYALMGCTVAPGFEFGGFRFVSSLPDHSAHFDGSLAAYSGLL